MNNEQQENYLSLSNIVRWLLAIPLALLAYFVMNMLIAGFQDKNSYSFMLGSGTFGTMALVCTFHTIIPSHKKISVMILCVIWLLINAINIYFSLVQGDYLPIITNVTSILVIVYVWRKVQHGDFIHMLD